MVVLPSKRVRLTRLHRLRRCGETVLRPPWRAVRVNGRDRRTFLSGELFLMLRVSGRLLRWRLLPVFVTPTPVSVRFHVPVCWRLRFIRFVLNAETQIVYQFSQSKCPAIHRLFIIWNFRG